MKKPFNRKKKKDGINFRKCHIEGVLFPGKTDVQYMLLEEDRPHKINYVAEVQI